LPNTDVARCGWTSHDPYKALYFLDQSIKLLPPGCPASNGVTFAQIHMSDAQHLDDPEPRVTDVASSPPPQLSPTRGKWKRLFLGGQRRGVARCIFALKVLAFCANVEIVVDSTRDFASCNIWFWVPEFDAPKVLAWAYRLRWVDDSIVLCLSQVGESAREALLAFMPVPVGLRAIHPAPIEEALHE
jgi:hypothetical protein